MLEVRNVSVTYGRHRALDGTSVSVGKGEICVILGANGAGKSTLLKTIAGMVHAAPGSEIVMNGKTIAGMKPHRIVEEGIALVPEGRGIFGDLTVAENLQLGAFARRARSTEDETLKRVYELFPRLAERRKQVARTMSGGEQQMVAIGRALMSKPDILMLDEPSLGLSPLLSQELFRSLKAVAETGVGILLVEQNAKQSLKIAGRGYLLENGHVTGENSASALMNDPAVVNAYLGGGAKGAGARPKIELPAPMRLPVSVEAMGRALGDFAARAGRISHAFVRAVRRDGPLPSAFVGRYDPKVGGDPWRDVEEAGRAAGVLSMAGAAMHAPSISLDARRIGDNAAALASRAGERLSQHVRISRLSAPRPSAFAHGYMSNVPAVPAWAGAAVGQIAHGGAPTPSGPAASTASPENGALARQTSLSIADLASRASAIHAAHVARLRVGRAGIGAARPVSPDPVPEFNGSHGLIGHNSAGLNVEEHDVRETVPQPAPGLSIADLAARAAEIQARHVAARRAGLATVSTMATTPLPPPSAVPLPRLAGEEPRWRPTATLVPPLRSGGGGPRSGGGGVETPDGESRNSSTSAAFLPAAVRDPVREAVSGSIGDLVARAATIHASHVAAGRKRLAAFTIPVLPTGTTSNLKDDTASGKRKKHKET
jgi:branched-chain amino acid transport system ATP-binding protein